MLVLIIQLYVGCRRDTQRRIVISTDESFNLLMNDTLNTEVKWYNNGLVESIMSIDKSGIKNGIQLEYHPNGILKESYFCENGKISGPLWKYNELGGRIYYSNYINGIKTGDTYEFNNDLFLKSHFLFEDENAIYLGYYEKGEKQINSPIPVFIDEKNRNDSIYEARITFPFPFKGNLEIYFQDTINFKKEYLDKYNLNLIITNYDRSWKKFEMLLEYEPVENDSLVWTEQVYSRTIRIE